jgi:hypothetical protein
VNKEFLEDSMVMILRIEMGVEGDRKPGGGVGRNLQVMGDGR